MSKILKILFSLVLVLGLMLFVGGCKPDEVVDEDPIVVVEKFAVTFEAESGIAVDVVGPYVKNTEVVVTVVAPEGKVFEKLLLDEVEVEVVEGVYTLTVTKNHVLTVTYTDEEVVEVYPKEVVAEYAGETGKFDEDATVNHATLIGLDEEVFEVLGTVIDGGSYKTPVGVNTDGTIRVYGVRATGEGNILTVKIKEGFVISKVEIEFVVNSNAAAVATTAELILGDVGEDLVATDIVSTTLVRDNLSIGSFSLQNTGVGQPTDKNVQIWIKTITITYAPVAE